MIDNLPNGWKIEELGNLGKVFTGSSAPQEEKYFKNGKYPFIRVSDLSNKKFNRKLNIVNDYINDKCLNEKTQTFANKGTILFAKSGMSVRNNHRAILDIDGYIVSHLCAIYIEEKYTREYIYHLLCKIDMVNYSENEAYPSLKTSTIKLIKVPIPPLQQQEKIVKILNLTSNLIEKQKELLEKYDLFLKSKFIEMFGDPITNPMGWEIVNFEDIMVLQRGYDLPINDRAYGNIEVYGSNGVLDYHSEAKVKNGGVITGRSGTLGKVHYTLGDYWPLNTTLFSKDLKGNNIIYLAYFLEMFKVERFSQGAGVPTLNRNLVHKEKTYKVPLELQNKFASIVEKIETIKEKENQKLKQFEDLHNSMMNKAFKGEIK
ncbi:restriction endonuclease subunit S [Aliarcobacter butzleri]|uniref:restriction endonuclease subunit S n=1 Tax=Aliarcobacter butzleri TaxID=28197 RepID=UPI00344EAD28